MTTFNLRPVFSDNYLKLSLNRPPFGLIMQSTPLRARFTCLPSPTNSLSCHGPNIPYPVYTPIVGMPRYYRLVGNATIWNLQPEQLAGRVPEGINMTMEDESLGIPLFVEPLFDPNLPRTRVRDRIANIRMRYHSIRVRDHIANTRMSDHIARHVPDDDHSFLVPGISSSSYISSLPRVDLNLPPTRTRDHITRHVPDDDHSSLVPEVSSSSYFSSIPGIDLNLPPARTRVHIPEHISLVHELEVAMNEEVSDFLLNNLASDSDLTYEETLELEEQMGRVGSRLSEEKIMQHMQIRAYSTTTTSTKEEPDICVICQGEFEYGEFVGGLRCRHEYHVQCIKKWLQQINSCPICKATAVS